jgi:hypothetical protein
MKRKRDMRPFDLIIEKKTEPMTIGTNARRRSMLIRI